MTDLDKLEALERLEKYLSERAKMRQTDPNDIHGLHIGTDREAVLMVDDLHTLIASARRDAEEIERLRAFAGRMIELVGTAFYDGFRDAIDREKWDDCYDYAAVKGSDYARDAVQKLAARAAHTGEG